MTEELLPNLFRIKIPLPDNPLKYLNSYVIMGSERNLIIDTGLNRKECLDAMHTGLSELNLDLEETDFFVTHLHADHFGLVSKLVSANRKTYFNRPETEILEAWGGWETMINYGGQNGFPKDDLRAALNSHPGFKFSSSWVPELSILCDEDTITIGDYCFKCVETPGHTRGHTCLYEPRKKILISGDHILSDITPNIQCWSDQEDPLKNYLDSLDKVHQLDVDLVLPGHRRVFRNFRERIAELKKHHSNRAEEILVILSKDPRNAFRVASEMTWDISYESWEQFPLAQKWFATGEAIAHLRYLEEKGRISRKTEGGVTFFLLNREASGTIF
jgi:glyoxylase-like metal-dependent hydrolase (beta-lactamase superfamily II)